MGDTLIMTHLNANLQSWNLSMPKLSFSLTEKQKENYKALAEKTFTSAGKLSLSAAYLTAGVSLISIGTWSSLFAAAKTVQYFVHTPPVNNMSNGYGFMRSGEHAEESKGFGKIFEVPCQFIVDWTFPLQGSSTCESMSQRTWAEIIQPPYPALDIASTLTFAIAFPLVVFNVSKYMVSTGLSLIEKSSKTFYSLFPEQNPKRQTQ